MKFITAESVTAGHPDKLADYIADCILDECMAQDRESRVACEVMLSHEVLMIAGEITTNAKVDYQAVAEKAIKQIGYEPPDSFVDDIFAPSPVEPDGSWTWGSYYKDLFTAVAEYQSRTESK